VVPLEELRRNRPNVSPPLTHATHDANTFSVHMGFCSAIAQAYSGTRDPRKVALLLVAKLQPFFGRRIATHGFAQKLGTPKSNCLNTQQIPLFDGQNKGKLAIKNSHSHWAFRRVG
jgi:hypothetical protein